MALSQPHEWQAFDSTDKTADATLEQFKILYKKYKVKIYWIILNDTLTPFRLQKIT